MCALCIQIFDGYNKENVDMALCMESTLCLKEKFNFHKYRFLKMTKLQVV